jgi:Flp pilus assembly protein TadD
MLGVLEDAVGDQEAAMRAYRSAIELGDRGVSPRAAFNLGVLLGADADAAASAYRLAIDTRHWDVAPKAAFNLGRVLERVGDRFGARLAYEQAIDFGHDDVTPNACSALELLGRPRATSEEQQLGLSNM